MAIIYDDATYIIVLSDKALCSQYQGQFPDGLFLNPTAAAAQYTPSFNTSFWTTGGDKPSSPRVDLYFNNPAVLPFNVDSVPIPAGQTVSINGDIFVFPGAPAHTLRWKGFFLLEPALSAFVPKTPLASRRWAVGFELPKQGEGVTGGALSHSSRDASRTPKGLGFAYRSTYNESITHSTTAVNPIATPAAPTASYAGTPITPPGVSGPVVPISATYKIVAFNGGGSSLGSPGGSFSTSAPNNDTYGASISWTHVPGTIYYAVYRVTDSGVIAPPSTGIIGTVIVTFDTAGNVVPTSTQFFDSGQAGDGTVAPAVNRIAPGSSWERIYIRVRTLPTGGEDQFWYCNGSVEAGSSVIATLAPGGAIKFYSKGNAAYPGTLQGTINASDVPLNTWIRLDIFIAYRNADPNFTTGGALTVSLIPQSGGFGAGYGSRLGNGFGPVIISSGGGLNTTQKHITSSIGNEGLAVSSFGSEIDIDDWIGLDVPQTLQGRDWNYGSHVTLVNATGFDPASTGWTGDYRILEGNPVIGQSANDFLQSSTANAPLVVTTDLQDIQQGCAALTVGAYAFNAGGLASSLGYGFLGQPTQTFPVTATTGQWMTVIRSFTDNIATDPVKVFPVVLQYNKDNSGSTQKIQALAATAEFIGDFGLEDFPSVVWPPVRGVHNAPYADSASVRSFTPPLAGVAVMSGTYVGNGTGQDIPTQIPLHWWWCRPLTANSGGSHWWSSLLAGHDQTTQKPAVNRLVQARQLPPVNGTPGPCQVQISGGDSQINQNGITYQWVGFSDPGQRYVLNGAISHISTLASATDKLADSTFAAQAGFFCLETEATTTDALRYTGPGMGAATMSLSGTSFPNTVILNSGSLFTQGFATSLPQLGYSLWRTDDSQGLGTPVAITTYTGDGTGSRNIPLILGGFSPLFAMVQPNNGKAYFRDPSHTGVNSQPIDTSGSVTTAITAGTANQITVDTTLNANTVVYSVFVLASGQTSGWGTNPSSPSGDGNNPIIPIIGAATTNSPSSAWAPIDTRGWWGSTLGFRGAADLITTPQNPKHPRCWDKVAAFANGNAAMLGGAPGAGITFDNNLIYAGDDYSLGTQNPIIRIFDGLSDRLMATVPSTSSSVVPQALMTMIVNEGTIYFTTFDSGTTSANFAGRVFTLDPLSQNIVPLGTSSFSGGEVPYAMVWHMGRLWLGTNKSDGTAGKIYFIRPGIDADWTLDHNLSSDSTGGVCSMWSFQGKLYIGTDNAAASFAKVIVRDSLGAYTTSLTATGGTARKNNGFLSMHDFNNNLFVGYWNPDTTAIAVIYKFDGTSWTISYTGSDGTLRPFIGQFTSNNYLFVIGGGDNLSAALVGTPDGTNWDNLTPFLTGPTTETALPIFGGVGA